jgi:hypothetical protein
MSVICGNTSQHLFPPFFAAIAFLGSLHKKAVEVNEVITPSH